MCIFLAYIIFEKYLFADFYISKINQKEEKEVKEVCFAFFFFFFLYIILLLLFHGLLTKKTNFSLEIRKKRTCQTSKETSSGSEE